MKQPANCKYTPLENHLRALSANHTIQAFSFEKIENTMRSKFPKSVYTRLTRKDNTVQGHPRTNMPGCMWDGNGKG